MHEGLGASLGNLALRTEYGEVANANIRSTTRAEDICDDCLAVPWESFGASDSPGPSSTVEPFLPWEYTVPEGHTWPQDSTCQVCRFIRNLLVEYGFESTTSVRRLRGGWDAEKPFKITFLELDESDEDSIDTEHNQHEGKKALLESDQDPRAGLSENHEQEQDSEDEAYAFWGDAEDGHRTLAQPSFLVSSFEVQDFQCAMQGYRPTNIDFEVIKEWLQACERTHADRCAQENRQYVRNLKVIDCAKRSIVPAPSNCPFVALSYVWGPPSAQPSLASPDIAISLPRTIEDSIVVVRALGYTYLWVDRYCINQDNEQEKQEQIAQMADIYSSSAVTIIAVAGEDPGYGLPGIRSNSRGLNRYQSVRSTRLFANPYIDPCSRYPPYYVHESKWASRAWTFQECYNSPRRLFFTAEQITLVCNSAVYQETTGAMSYPRSSPIYANLRGWIKQDDSALVPAAVLEAVPYPLACVMDILNAYSHRQMSYDSDALNAIMGTLNAFSRHSISHLWGVPIWAARDKDSAKLSGTLFSSTANKASHAHQVPDGTVSAILPRILSNKRSNGSIALLWHHHSPCKRRIGFPSWSPLGWQEGIGWFARQTPRASGGDFITMLANYSNVVSDTIVECNDSRVVPQQLILETPTVELHLGPPLDDKDEIYQHCVAISLDCGLDVLMATAWDKSPKFLQSGHALKGLLMIDANSSGCCPESTHYAILVVEQHGDCWERVAIALLRNNYITLGLRADDTVCDVSAAHPPLFQSEPSGNLYNWDLSPRYDASLEPLDVSHLSFEHNEPWWRKYSCLERTKLI